MERVFENVQIEVLNLSASLDIKDELKTVSITLSGNMPVLEDYILSKHAVQINLNDCNEPGLYTVPLRYILPSNLQLIEQSDEEISVTLIPRTDEKHESETANLQNVSIMQYVLLLKKLFQKLWEQVLQALILKKSI